MNTRKAGFVSAIALNILICLVTAVIFITAAKASARENLEKVHNTAAESAVSVFNESLTAHFSLLKDADFSGLTAQQIPDGYLGIAYSSGGGVTDYVLKDAPPAQSTNIIPDSFKLDGAQNTGLIFPLINEKKYVGFTLQNQSGFNILLAAPENLGYGLRQFGFKNVLLIENDGRVIASLFGYDQKYFDFDLIKSMSDFVSQSDTQSAQLKLIAITPGGIIDSYINKTVIYSLVFAVVLVAAAVISGTFLLLTILRGDYTSLYKEGKFYVITADSMGRVTGADKNFKKDFDIKNIFDYIYDKEHLKERIFNGFITLMLVRNDNKAVYIRCKSKYENEKFRLIGYDVSELFSELIDTKKMLNCDMVTGLQHDVQFVIDFKKAVEENFFESFAVAVIEITNAGQLRTMFGNDTFFKMQKIFSDMLLELYSPQIRVYYSMEEKYILFADNTMRSEILINNLAKHIAELEAPMHVNGNIIKPVVKAGINKVDEAVKYHSALRDAKIALKYAKLSANKSALVYDARIMKSVLNYYETKESIIELINSSMFEVHYQPQYSLSEKRIIGFEALTRINSPEFKNISVQEFIETAERNGAIIELGNKIYGMAMEFAKSLEGHDVVISLNVSPIQFMQDGFTEIFLSKFRKLGLQPGSISIEITESFMMQSYDDIIDKMLILKKAGISLHLDDFGTEYSSMLYLNKLPINVIKIDKEFVSDILNNAYSKTIVGFMIKLSSDLNLTCIVEGVETAEQSELIKELGGDVIQGYYISKAVPPEQAAELLSKRHAVKK